MVSSNLSIKYLCLDKFRNYDFLELDLANGIIVIAGPNGSGKTNILEAISLFAPGSGFRNSKLSDMDNHHFKLPWCIDAKINSIYGIKDVQTARTSRSGEDKRIIQIDGNISKNRAEIAKIFSVIWLTPQMDQLFINSRSNRLRFFDQLVVNFIPDHLYNINKYEYYMRERLKLLKNNFGDEEWLRVLEKNMADFAIQIANARANSLEYMQESIDETKSLFPKSILKIDGFIEEKIKVRPAIDIEEFFIKEIKKSRQEDKLSGRTNFGVHRSNFYAVHQVKSIPVRLCSTGEQKAILISIILAEVRARKKQKSSSSVLLLDEVVAHLDNEKREELFKELEEIGCQAIITTTGTENFLSLKNKAQFFSLEKGIISESFLKVNELTRW